jgi:precorrin-6Y C5,15-methyltransferase (decarboxylating)
MLRHPQNRAYAVEARADRGERIRRNAMALGVPELALVQGAAPQALEALPTPGAIFIGGGFTDENVFEVCWARLRSGGRLVANAVTLETEARLLALFARYGGALKRIAISRAEPVGTLNGWRAAMPVTQWAVTKP